MPRPNAIQDITVENTKKRVMVFGDPGTGKTTLAGTSPNALILDADRGTNSAAAMGTTAKKWVVSSYDEMDEAYEYIKDGDHSFDWVWLDSGTIFQERCLMDDIMLEAVIENPRQNQYIPSQREYLLNMNRFSQSIRKWVALDNIHFGITAHALRLEDYDDESVTYMPAIQGKGMSAKICAYMDVVGYYGLKKIKDKESDKVKTVRRMLFHKTGKFYAKDRFNALGRWMDDPTIPDMMELIDKATIPNRKKKGAA